MELVRNIENTMRGWYKDLPHLPADISKLVAQNTWWLAIIGLVLGVMSIMATLSVLGVGTAIGAFYAPLLGIELAVYGLWVLFLTFALVIQAKAVMPLKAMQRQGWELLFLAFLVTATGGTLSEIFKGNIAGTLASLIVFAIGAYVLFEVDQYFGAKSKK